MNVEQKLINGADKLEVKVSLDQAKKMFDFLALISKWNHIHNLTSINVLDEMLIKHLLDSLSVIKFLPLGDVADIGSGAGLPGIPLAIMRPEQKFHLVDASYKRVVFMQQVKRILALNNLTVEHARVENIQPRQFDVVLSRAFTSLLEFIKKTEHIISKNGLWLAMKGQYPEQEISEVQLEKLTLTTKKIFIPNLDAERHLVLVQKINL